MKTLLERKDVNSKYQWDLEFLLANDSVESILDKIKKLDQKKYELINNFYQSVENFDLWLKLSREIGILGNKVYNYVSNKLNEEVTNNNSQKAQQQVMLFFNDLSQKYANLENIMLKNKTAIKKILANSKYKNLIHNYEDLFRSEKHILSDVEEQLLSKLSLVLDVNHDIFATLTDGDFNFGKVKDATGKEHFLLQGNFVEMLKNQDATLRENAFMRFWEVYNDHKNTLAKTLYNHHYSVSVDAKIRKYDDSVSMQTFSDKINHQFLNKLYDNVKNQTPLFKKYFKNRNLFLKKKLGVKKLNPWDKRLDLITDLKIKFSKENGIDLIKEAIKPLGSEYSETINRAISENWVDFEPSKGKRSGAYSIGASYGLDKKYILMNWNDNFNSVTTLAHELGHSLHSYFSDKYQDYFNASYPIILAEIASTFNEVLLAEHLLKNSSDDKLKFYVISNLLDTFVGTVHRQTMWSNYEFNAFQTVDAGKPLVFNDYAKMYEKNMREYYGMSPKTKMPLFSELGSVYVPHFYYNFYVYKYAVGIISALSFIENFHSGKDNNLNIYINNFLKAGGRDYPLVTLKNAGVDLLDEKTYDQAFKYFDNLLTEYIELGNKIFK